MRVGVPKEVKVREYRVGLVPDAVRELCARGHEVVVETEAGLGIGASDDAYVRAGATIVNHGQAVFDAAELIVKVKEPQAEERQRLRMDHLLFTYLHLASDRQQTLDLLNSGAACIAYETVTSPQGGLPLLAPMSEVAGRLAVQVGAYHLQKHQGGLGVLLGGVPGVPPSRVTILGGGTVGMHAAAMAIGLGARVTVLDRDLDVLRKLSRQFGSSVELVHSNAQTIEHHCLKADLLIAGVLIPGARAPKLVSIDLVKRMKSGAVIVDVAIDQGGCCETSHPTSHEAPTYSVYGVVHYCVSNMPGAVPRTSSYALNNATLPYILALADKGVDALREDPFFCSGLNAYRGMLTCAPVAQALGLEWTSPLQALKQA